MNIHEGKSKVKTLISTIAETFAMSMLFLFQ